MPDLPATTTYDTTLPNLTKTGQAPESRVTDCERTRSLILSWIWNDQQGRSPKRAKTTGLIEGNPPYRLSDLVAHGRGDATNVNWRTAEAYEEAAKGAFYDVFAEAPTFATIELDAYGVSKGGYGVTPNSDYSKSYPPDKIVEWSGIVTEEFDVLQKGDPSWDSTMQNSQRETVRYGAGPLIFSDRLDWRPKYVQYGYLQLPDDAPSDINRWECAAIIDDLLAHELYCYIRNPEVARDAGWDVEAVRKAIMSASPDVQQSSAQGLTWEWVQQQLKQDSFSYSARSNIIKIAHFYAREFPLDDEYEGKITHTILVLSPQADANHNVFLYRKNRCYQKWQECIHPMYYSQGEQGKHYGVTGQGVKMYGAMETENRLMCNMVDKALAPKVMFKPTTASGKQKALPQRYGDYAMLPEGYDLQQVSIHSMVEDGLVVKETVARTVASNLSSYRQTLDTPKRGNPITKAEVEVRAGNQAQLGKTQLNRYYEQLDWVYEEKYRRACNSKLRKSDPGGAEALAFQERCSRRGVPKDLLLKYCSVKATRVMGQGSPFLRQQNSDFFLAIAGALPEEGRANVIKDAIAARSTQFMVERYYPERGAQKLASDQEAEAMQQVAGMKVGVPPVVTSTQNPLIFAQAFLQAGAQALGSLQQSQGRGGIQQATEVLSFLQQVGPAAAAHIQRMAQDPTRKGQHAQMEKQLQQLAKAADQLNQKVQQALQQQQKEAQKRMQEQMQAGRKALAVAQGQDPQVVVGLAGVEAKRQVDTAKAQSQAQLKARKQAFDEGLKAGKAQQDMALDDATTAASIVQEDKKTNAAVRAQEKKAAAAARKPAPSSK